MVRWTKKLIRQQFTWTNECFRDALAEVYADILDEHDKLLDEASLKFTIINKMQELHWPPLMQWPESVNEIYLRNIRKLPTDQIELIIEAYSKGKFGRSPLTIDVLTTELLERSLNSETRTKHE